MREKQIIYAARTVSLVFTPFYLPLVGMAALFVFSYMSLAPWTYKATLLLMVYLFTILFPTLLIRAYRRRVGMRALARGKEMRLIPYIIAILCYFMCYFLMNRAHIPQFMSSIIVAALLIQVVCALINTFWKISTHTAAIGGFEGALLAYSLLFNFNPLGWFCFILILAGMVGTSRIILRQHSLSQVVTGFLLGAVIAFWAII